MQKPKYIIGIDEVGRGPLAGPVMVGVAAVPLGFDWSLLPGVTDSKKLTERRREEIYRLALALRQGGLIEWRVAKVSARQIDKQGIVAAIKQSLQTALRQVMGELTADPTEVRVLLDGGLTAPSEYQRQQTIIKGDLHEPVIGLASIVAKVTRDRYMCQLAKRVDFAPYNFAQHKGYGTKAHRAAILVHGASPEHRQSFCRNILIQL